MGEVVKMRGRPAPQEYDIEMPDIHIAPAQVTVQAPPPAHVTVNAPPPAQVNVAPVVKILDQRPTDELATAALTHVAEVTKGMTDVIQEFTKALQELREELVILRTKHPTVVDVIRNDKGEATKLVALQP